MATIFTIVRGDGKYSLGKTMPKWGAHGKAWTSQRSFRSHLGLVLRAHPQAYKGCTVVVYQDAGQPLHPFAGLTPEQAYNLKLPPNKIKEQQRYEGYTFFVRSLDRANNTSRVSDGRGPSLNGRTWSYNALKTHLRKHRWIYMKFFEPHVVALNLSNLRMTTVLGYRDLTLVTGSDELLAILEQNCKEKL